MFVFIDESGIHKAVEHSTFVLVYIEIKDHDEVISKFEELEKHFNIDHFHWSEVVWKIKEQFIGKVLKLDFKAKIAVIKNPINSSEELEKALVHLLVERDVTRVFIDGKKPKWYERKIKKVLRDKGMSIRKLHTVNSRQYPGVRLADLVAGLSRAHFDGRNQKVEKYYERLEKKTIVVSQIN